MFDAARRDVLLLARFVRLLAVALLTLFAVELLAATGVVPEPIANIFEPLALGQFFAMALLGTFVLHLWCGPPRREALLALALGLSGELVRVALCVRAGWAAKATILGSGL